jgi:hypothetical protein
MVENSSYEKKRHKKPLEAASKYFERSYPFSAVSKTQPSLFPERTKAYSLK